MGHSFFALGGSLLLCAAASAAPQLDVVWQASFSGASGTPSLGFEIESSAIGLRNGGYLIATAEHDGSATTRHILRRFTENGTVVWVTELPVPVDASPPSPYEGISEMHESQSGDILCHRTTRRGPFADQAERSAQWIGADGAILDATPAPGWIKPSPDGGHFLAEGSGTAFIATNLKRFTRDGTLVWERQLDGRVSSLEVDPCGNAYVFGRNEKIMYTAIPMMAGRVSYAGQVASTTCIEATCAYSGPAWFQDEAQWNLFGTNAGRLGLDDRGHVQFSSSDGSAYWVVHSFDRAGGLTWSYSTGGTGVNEIAFRTLSGGDGSVWIVGQTTQPSGADETFIRRLSPDGIPLWTRYEPLSTWGLHDVAVDGEGRLFFTLEDPGAGGATLRVVGFDRDGVRLGSYDSGLAVSGHHQFQRRSSLAVDELGGVVFVQSEVTGPGDFDVRTVATRLVVGGDQSSVSCSQVWPNSTGVTGSLMALGASERAVNDLSLFASDLPAASTGLFLTAAATGFIANPGGSAGSLCLGAGLGRYIRTDEVRSTDAAGQLSLRLDLSNTPGPFGDVNVMAGETRYFQLWHRDTAASTALSNFTDAIAVTLL